MLCYVMLCYVWSNVVDGGPTLNQHRFDVLCLLGCCVGSFCVVNQQKHVFWGHTRADKEDNKLSERIHIHVMSVSINR